MEDGDVMKRRPRYTIVREKLLNACCILIAVFVYVESDYLSNCSTIYNRVSRRVSKRQTHVKRREKKNY